MPLRGTWIVLLFAFLAIPAMADMTAKAVLMPPNVPIYRTAQYVVELEGPKGLTAPPVKIADALKDIEVTAAPATSEPLPDDRERVRLAFTLDPKEPGEYTIPGTTIELGDGKKLEIPAVTFTVHDTTEDEEKQVAAFVDIGDPALVAPPQPAIWLYVIAGFAALAAIACGVWYWQKNKGIDTWTPPALKPWQVAQNRLDELALRRLPQQGRFEPYYVDLSAILRYYIEDRFHLRAPERTTPEFLDEASRVGVMNDVQQAMLAQFLRHCDRVKFAQYEPSFDEMENSFAVVKQFVIETTPSPVGLEAVKEAA